MRRSFFLLFISFVFVLAASAQVTFFSGPNHTGASMKVYEGSISRMSGTVIGNDRLSSMIVPPGYRVTLYQHDYFGGYAETFTYSILNMPPRLVNEVSSLVVTSDNGAGWVGPQGGAQAGWNLGSVMIYSECYYGGRANPLLPANYPTMPNNFNFSTSSIRIPAGYEMDIFTQPNYGGRMVRLRGDESCLPPEWNNAISSVRVYKTTSGFIPPDNYNPWNSAVVIGPNGSVVVNPNPGSVVVNPNQGAVVVNPNPGGVVINPNPGSVVVTQPGYFDQFSVTLYDRCFYAGRNAPLADGNYSILPYGFQDNVLSVRVPKGKEVILYAGPNFTGPSYRLVGDRNCLQGNNEYRVSSIRILPSSNNGGSGWVGGITPPVPQPIVVPPPSQEVQVFTDCYFQGRTMTLRPGRNLFLISPFSNNISSIRVPYRRRVTVFTGVNFTGHSWTLTADNPCLSAHFNNRIQSMIVEAY
jgi:hypothetical protein